MVTDVIPTKIVGKDEDNVRTEWCLRRRGKSVGKANRRQEEKSQVQSRSLSLIGGKGKVHKRVPRSEVVLDPAEDLMRCFLPFEETHGKEADPSPLQHPMPLKTEGG